MARLRAEAVQISRRNVLMTAAGLALAAAPKARASAAGLIRTPRSIALDAALCQMLLALSHAPIATTNTDFYRKYVIEPPLPETVVDLGLRPEPNLELIAQLDPEIVFFSLEFGAFRGLGIQAEMIPLSIYDGASCYANCVSTFLAMAARIGASARADAYLGHLQGVVDACASATKALKTGKVCVFSFLGGRNVRVYTASGLFGAALDLVGIPNAIQMPGNHWGFTDIGAEAFAAIDCQWAVHIGPLPPQSATSLIWRAMPVVRAGRVRSIPPVWMFGGLPSMERFLRELAEAFGSHG